MDKSALVRSIGFPATLIHGDPLVLDRWRWLKKRLPKTRNGERLLDVGCGSGAFTIGAALRGYQAIGLSWNERNQSVAKERAQLCGATSAEFEEQDIRDMDQRRDLLSRFDVVICLEAIEHIIDDLRLMRSLANSLKPGGRLLLTTPYAGSRPISAIDMGPFSTTEDGGHVRRGYSQAMLKELCDLSGLSIEEVSYCSGYFSQKLATVQRRLVNCNQLLAWVLTAPARVLPLLLDSWVTPLINWPKFSICLEAYKPRFPFSSGPSMEEK